MRYTESHWWSFWRLRGEENLPFTVVKDCIIRKFIGMPTIYNRWYFIVDRVNTKRISSLEKAATQISLQTFEWTQRANINGSREWLLEGQWNQRSRRTAFVPRASLLLHFYTHIIRRKTFNKPEEIMWKLICPYMLLTLYHEWNIRRNDLWTESLKGNEKLNRNPCN